MENNEVQVLILAADEELTMYVTKYGFYAGPGEMIKKLGKPHNYSYKFRLIDFGVLDKSEEEEAWYMVNTVFIPSSSDPKRDSFLRAFDLLWETGYDVF